MAKSFLCTLLTSSLTLVLTSSMVGAIARSKSGEMASCGKGTMEQCQKQCQQISMKNLGPSNATYDLRFMNMMIVHHKSAVDMSKDALKKANHPEIKHMAQEIITAQEKETAQLEAWRKEWYGI